MSLINQMLQDLDARKQSAQSAASAPAAAWQAAHAVRQSRWRALRRSLAPILLPFLCLLLFAALAAYWLFAARHAAAPAPVANVASSAPRAGPAAAAPAAQESASAPARSSLAGLLDGLPGAAILGQPQERELPQEVAAPLVQGLKLDMQLKTAQAASDKREDAPAAQADKSAPKASAQSAGSMQILPASDSNRAEAEYRKATQLQQNGKSLEALAALESALLIDKRHSAARLSLASILSAQGRPEDALKRLQHGLAIDPGNTAYTMLAARIKAESGQLAQAIDSLYGSLPLAVRDPEYQGLLAALLQKDRRHKDAIEHFFAALQARPDYGVWWMGLGISLQAEGLLAQARDAYLKARGSQGMSPQLLTFIDQRLLQIVQATGKPLPEHGGQ
ncbi:tetratricopeptide repeat protein [Massilia sp. W12]|uniref:tetratricopeptide repeat protein n=1 Tax=Massilia sp. W12 TaxID=3126507 RepID=UPI0030D4D8A5